MSRPKDTEYERRRSGSKRSKRIRPGDSLVPTAAGAPPVAPSFLKGEARQSWDRMAKSLHAAKILVEVSRDKLIRYCVAWAEWSACVEEKQDTEKPRNWSMNVPYTEKLDHWHKIMERTEKVMQDFEKHYGLTPLAATKIGAPSNVGGKTPEEELDEFLEDKDEDDEDEKDQD